VETPFGRTSDALGGSAVFFSAAAALFHPVRLVGVVGGDYPAEQLGFLATRGVDLSGLAWAEGDSFRWSGYYDYDLNTAVTLETRLGVFADFRPKIPESFRDAEWVFLANIDPDLQLEVLDQVRAPRLVACDTMNFWIDAKKESLVRLLERVDVLLINDAEIRALSGDYNLVGAARWVHERGPRLIVVKKGEHGAMLFTPEMVFFAPGYPLEEVFDPTGAGDAFAGGFLGYLAQAGTTDPEELRRAMIYGSALGSFAVERFGVERLVGLTPPEVHERVAAFREMTAFEHPWTAGAHA
ncbi:MAG: sugar kinase, partial [Gemmatimonadetes bacterium]|nr:sugar kinase [Gemmatimonadota bacterium]NIQ56136.1 sugar kinase [Gemmatimonadota bacterium]NIU76323.1 sugar kinase [Gammaproteobacteria bacterium]NIX45822.1 sugar kinase [Gemmatimonadota bacterium]NIY10131.1 sugar kinase [Gemmatimonadota bacterium]